MAVKKKSSNPLQLLNEAKAREKEIRGERFLKAMERKMTLKYRRMGKPNRGIKKHLFKSWFDEKKVWESVQDKSARRSNKAWIYKVSVVVERMPIVIPHPPAWEKDFMELQEYLHSFKLHYPEDSPFALANKNSADPEEGVIRTEKTFWEYITKGQTIPPRVTEADETNDTSSLNRKLDERLFLLKPENNDRKQKHYFPTTIVQEGETFIQASRRVIQETFGENMTLYCPSNCPMAVDMNLMQDVLENKDAPDYYHQGMMETHFGEKIFFIRCHRDRGDVVGLMKGDYAWLGKDEIVEKVKTEKGDHASRLYYYLL